MVSISSPAHDRLVQDGYIFLPAWEPQATESEAIGRIGTVQQISNYEDIHNLTPREQAESSKNSYSGTFGCGAFPLHTDFAHWFVPPRYLVLRCIIGAIGVATRLVDVRPLVNTLDTAELSRALLQPRRMLNGRRPLLHLYEKLEGGEIRFRWDSLFTVPASLHSRRMCDAIYAGVTSASPHDHFLCALGDTLVIDNWRMLHGRTEVPESARNRRICRAYLTHLS